MAESENPCPRRIRIRFKVPGGLCPAANPDGDECLKPTCKSLKRNRIDDDSGFQTSRDAKHVTESAKVPELSNKNGTFSSKRSQSSLKLPTSNQLKRSKRSTSTKRRPSIDNLPDAILVEILCRLPCNKFVFQCKSVSKRWRALTADPYFIGRFVHIQSYMRTAKIRTLMSKEGEEFPPKMSFSSRLLTPVFESIKSIRGWIEKPVVVATYRDLVLCCASRYYQSYYYICNAYTMQWVALPLPPIRHHKSVRVGFICDIPDYNSDKDNFVGHNIHLNAECRCKVVRILPPNQYANDEKCDSFKLNVEIFSSETGEWTESAVSSPRYFSFHKLGTFSFVYHGTLYWPGLKLLFIGLGPFYGNNSTTGISSNGDGIVDHKLRFTVSEEPLPKGFVLQYLGICRGCVQMCGFQFTCQTLHFFELKEQDGAAGKLCLSNHKEYPLDPNMARNNSRIYGLHALDPYNKDILYLRAGGDLIKYNIQTSERSRIAENSLGVCNYLFPVEFPWWPTPVPGRPQHATWERALETESC